MWKRGEDYLVERNLISIAQVTVHRQITCRKDKKSTLTLGKSLIRELSAPQAPEQDNHNTQSSRIPGFINPEP